MNIFQPKNSIKIFFGVPHLATFIFFLFRLINEPGLGAEIDPGIDLTQFPSSMGRDLNPRPSNRESSMLTTRPDFRLFLHTYQY
jgi:hypothetical protein